MWHRRRDLVGAVLLALAGLIAAVLVVRVAWFSPTPHATSGTYEAPSSSDLRSTSEKARRPQCLGITGWDTFHRSDRPLAGDTAPSGQSYFLGGRSARIEAHRYVSTATPQVAEILYLPLPLKPSVIAGEYVFTSGVSKTQNVVIGTSRSGFGAHGSVQLAVSPLKWKLFYLTDPIVDPYPVIASGQFPTPLATDGRTRLRSLVRLLSPTKARIVYPGGATTVTDPHIATFWGDNFGVQVRRPYRTDGSAEVTAIAADTGSVSALEVTMLRSTRSLGLSHC